MGLFAFVSPVLSYVSYIYYVLCSGLSVLCFTKLPKFPLRDTKVNGVDLHLGNMLIAFLQRDRWED